MAEQQNRAPAMIERGKSEILAEWVSQQRSSARSGTGQVHDGELREQSQRFFDLFRGAVQSGMSADIGTPQWSDVRALLTELSRTRAAQGFTASETARFIFSLKQPLFSWLRKKIDDPKALNEETWALTSLIDNLGLFTTEVHQRAREDVISRQQQEMMELSTPVVQLWQGIVALPLIGTLDSARTQVVMENLLDRIVSTGADIAIIDITGVPTVDTLVAQHLLKTVAAARLMGADCIISGIRPQIAQTIVHLGIELSDVATKASLADAFALALRRRGLVVMARETRPGRS